MNVYKVIVVGMGKRGRHHAAAFKNNPRFELAGICSRDRGRLEAELDRVRRAGYATAVEELEVGLVAVAAPVFECLGSCLAAVSVSGPAYRLDPHGVADACVAAAAEISERLGFTRAA